MITQDIKSKPMSQINNLAKKLIPSAIIFIVVVIRAYPMLFAKFGPIDDHEIAAWLHNGQERRFNGFFYNLFSNYEITHWSETGRFRPIAYLFRILEASLYGDCVWMYYLERFILFSISIILIAKAVHRLTGFYKESELATYLSLALVLSILPSWQDVILRLGPSEIYLIFGYSLFLYGLSSNSDSKNRFMFIGALIAAGSKENGIFLLLAFSIFICLSKLGKITKSLFLITALSISLFIALGPILFSKNQNGVDVYGRKLTPISLLSVFYSNPVYFYVACSGVLFVLVNYITSNRAVGTKMNYLILVTCSFQISEQIFYKTKIGGYSRYSIVSQINFAILLFVLFSLIAARNGFLSNLQKYLKLMCILTAGIATFSSVPIVGVTNIRSHAQEMKMMTTAYQRFLTQISEQRNSDELLIMASADGDSEAASGTKDFLVLRNPSSGRIIQITNKVPAGKKSEIVTCLILGDASNPIIRTSFCGRIFNFNMKYFPSY